MGSVFPPSEPWRYRYKKGIRFGGARIPFLSPCRSMPPEMVFKPWFQTQFSTSPTAFLILAKQIWLENAGSETPLPTNQSCQKQWDLQLSQKRFDNLFSAFNLKWVMDEGGLDFECNLWLALLRSFVCI